MKDLKLRLIRHTLKEDYTEGELFNMTEDESLFDTLEDRVRDINGDGDLDDEDEGKVYGKTAIPYGTYELEVTYSPKFKMDMVLVKNVPNFTGIRMHYGYSADQSSGCILGGKKIADGKLKNTGYTKYMVSLLSKYGGKATLEII